MIGRPTSNYLRGFRWYRRSRLWVVPAAGAGAAILLAVVTLGLDHYLVSEDAPFPAFSGSADTARSMLTLIATSIATLTALVLTIVAVVIQLATQALSPRAVRTFLQDPHSHLTIGTFVATFTYSLVVLDQFQLNVDRTNDRITSTSITVAFVLAVLSLGMFISYVDHIVHQARVTSIIDQIGSETRLAILTKHDGADGGMACDARLPEGEPDHVIRSRRHGVVIEIDVAELVEAAARLDLTVVMVPAVGDFIPTGGRVFAVYGDRAAEADSLLGKVAIDAERSITQDVPFGFRLLIDIAQRSLSPGINDPTTATQVVDQLHDLLLMLGTRRLGNGWHLDPAGTPRLHVAEPEWDLYVALAFEEIRHYGADSLQVVRRIRAAIQDLRADLPEDRRPALDRQVGPLDAATERAFPSELERYAASRPDAQGIGSGVASPPTRVPPASGMIRSCPQPERHEGVVAEPEAAPARARAYGSHRWSGRGR